MEKNKKTIIVPWDFTPVANFALQHAIKISKITKDDIVLLNIVKKKKELEDTVKKLNSISQETTTKERVQVKGVAKEGSIFSAIAETADELDASLVVMGTHGIKGMQKFTGSWALKVIEDSKVPFIVVQDTPKREYYKNILFPVDYKRESKEKLPLANYLSKYFKTKLCLFVASYSDTGLSQKTKANLLFTRKYLVEKEIPHELIQSKEKGSVADQTISYAQKSNIDIILTMTTKNIGFQDYIFGAEEQQIIANHAKIPVMCINPRTDLGHSGFN